jgi:hypothetical protein
MVELTRIDRKKKRIYIRFVGFLSLDQAKELRDAYEEAITEVGSGYTVVTLFEDFKPGNEEVQNILADMIKMASDRGCTKAARVGRGSVVGPLQLQRLSRVNAKYPHRTFETLEEADAYLDSDKE